MTITTLGNNRFKKLIAVLILPLFLIGCGLTGEEIARLDINKLSTNNNFIVKEAILDLKKGDKIAFWSDMDMEYAGKVDLRFRLKIFKKGTEMSQIDIDPTKKNITIGEVKTTLMGKTNWSFTGKNHQLKIEEDGTYGFKAVLISSKHPSLKINKAELVIKK
ncbi:hypothetical protein [Olleya sp. R77988]|uniref:hypothetical protein n=1 Tax=Olleya sp. R77988 TaxID=3093875 RepID=UPI0037C91999